MAHVTVTRNRAGRARQRAWLLQALTQASKAA